MVIFPTGPAVFVTSDLKINEDILQPDDTGTVSVTVTNIGGETGTYQVVLKVNGETFATKSVTIDGGKSGVDQFRIKIWDKTTNTVIYDNKMGASDTTSDPLTNLSGGSIIIHK